MPEKILGVNVLVAAGGVTIGAQTDATLKIDSKEIDVSDKTTGGWDVSLVGNRKWGIEAECLALDSDTGQAAIETAAINGTTVSVSFAHGSRKTYTGTAVVTSFQLTGQKDGVSTCKVSFSGASALA